MSTGPPVTVDLNADLGEDPSGTDLALLDMVTTCHVACGAHAGDHDLMRRAVARAVACGVAVGAHPSYPDRAGFGRRELGRTPAQVADDVAGQLKMLDAVARAGGTRIVSVKAHGALYHRMSGDAECAAAVADAVTALDGPDMPALVLPAVDGAPTAAQAEVRAAVRARGLVAHFEAFCDRAYRADGSLLARSSPGAVITDPAEAGRRARALTLDGAVEAIDGTRLRLRPDTLCVHGDTAGAPAMARTVRTALEAAGVRVTAPTR